MRVLQLIDSLRPGGAEKMAVNIANALLPHVEKSFLCCTRQEGMLKDEVKAEVGYLFLNKKSRLDPKAIFKLRKYIRKNKIDLVHAHSTSFFLAGLLKLSGSKFQLIWHDHYGESENLEDREYKALKKFSKLFSGIISVNTALKEWALQNLYCKNVIEIRNFIPVPDHAAKAKIRLKGNTDAFKIICVANLRPQKDHLNLLQAFEILEPKLNVSLHLVGEDPGTPYSASVINKIEDSPFKNKIFYYGTQPEIISLLQQADLGVLSSRSEGLPLALIEYGIAGIPVVCTDVGKCAKIINGNGQLVPIEDPKAFAQKIAYYQINQEQMQKDAIKFNISVSKIFTEKDILKEIVAFYQEND